LLTGKAMAMSRGFAGLLAAFRRVILGRPNLV
jgi:hypothetical protein